MSVQYHIRKAIANDQADIEKLIRKTRINPTNLHWKRFLVAVSNEQEFLGCVQLKPHKDGTVELASLAVKKAFRRSGVASALMEKILMESPRPVYLMCRSRLGAFYKRFGFIPLRYDEMPVYFQRISRLVSILKVMKRKRDALLVMRLK